MLHIPKFLGNHKGAFCIYDKCDESLEKTDQPNWSNMNQSSYKTGKLNSQELNELLAGQEYFSVKEIETFQII